MIRLKFPDFLGIHVETIGLTWSQGGVSPAMLALAHNEFTRVGNIDRHITMHRVFAQHVHSKLFSSFH